MFLLTLTGKPTNFEFIDESMSKTLGACFTLTEEGFENGEVYTRHWTVWVPKHKTKWAERKTSKPNFKIMVMADWMNVNKDGIYICRASEILDL